MTSVQQVELLERVLKDNDLHTNLEVIGNLLVRISADYLELPDGYDTDPLSVNEFIEFILDHRKKYGETIANATALQGLTLLNWLNS